MISYASVTSTRRNVEALRHYGWRMLANCYYQDRVPKGFSYALDNGAWSAFQKGQPLDLRRFEKGLRVFGAGADWTVLPDIVAGGQSSLELSLKWMRPVLNECQRALIAVQDGMEPEDVRPFLGPRIGVFVGGSTEWKWATLTQWSRLTAEVGAWCHVGRVNSSRRIHQCTAAGAQSFDGTSCTRYSVNTRRLSHARDQLDLFTRESNA